MDPSINSSDGDARMSKRHHRSERFRPKSQYELADGRFRKRGKVPQTSNTPLRVRRMRPPYERCQIVPALCASTVSLPVSVPASSVTTLAAQRLHFLLTCQVSCQRSACTITAEHATTDRNTRIWRPQSVRWPRYQSRRSRQELEARPGWWPMLFCPRLLGTLVANDPSSFARLLPLPPTHLSSAAETFRP